MLMTTDESALRSLSGVSSERDNQAFLPRPNGSQFPRLSQIPFSKTIVDVLNREKYALFNDDENH
jgi:hypothetical protein